MSYAVIHETDEGIDFLNLKKQYRFDTFAEAQVLYFSFLPTTRSRGEKLYIIEILYGDRDE
jgi:hypothetical protein